MECRENSVEFSTAVLLNLFLKNQNEFLKILELHLRGEFRLKFSLEPKF